MLAVLPACCLLLFPACTERARDTEAPEEERIIQYLAGVEILGRVQAPDEEKGRRYAHLERLTGVTADDARAFLDRYRDDAARWKEIHEKIDNQLNEEASPKRKENSHGE